MANGLEAVSAVTQTPHDLVLMDIMMPEMDGVTATRKIRELPGQAGQIPIIALTANAMKGDREKYLDAGMSDYLPKPLTPAKLASMLGKWAAKIQVGDPRPDRPDMAPPAGAALVDYSVIDQMTEALGKEKVDGLVGSYVGSLHDRLDSILRAAASGDLGQLGFEAHNLKSTSGTFGAKALAGLAEQLERASRAGDSEDALGLVPEIKIVTTNVLAEFGSRYPNHMAIS